MKLKLRYKGGAGSGFHGHTGRPGEVGGSSSGKGGRKVSDIQELLDMDIKDWGSFDALEKTEAGSSARRYAIEQRRIQSRNTPRPITKAVYDRISSHRDTLKKRSIQDIKQVAKASSRLDIGSMQGLTKTDIINFILEHTYGRSAMLAYDAKMILAESEKIP